MLPPGSAILLKKLTVVQPMRKFPTFYGTHVQNSPFLVPNLSHMNLIQIFVNRDINEFI
jgi:hypothetical protein